MQVNAIGVGVSGTPDGAGRRATISLVIVADVRLYREGLGNSLRRREHLAIVGEAGTREQALELVASTRPGVVVIDSAAKDSLGTARAISRLAPEVKIVALAVDEVEPHIVACAEAGVAAWVPCDGSIDDLVHAIESVERGELVCSAKMAATLFRRLGSLTQNDPPPSADSPLTRREQDIAGLIERGLSNKKIAQCLTIEVATVKNHVHSILGKLGVATRGEVAANRRALAPRGSLRNAPAAHPRNEVT